jgi:hypothetical protein
MTTYPYDISCGSSHVTLSNLNSNGTIAIPANNTPVIVATVPLTTGPVALDVTTLVAEIYLSYDMVSDDGALYEQRRDYPVAAYSGNPTPASISGASLVYWGGYGVTTQGGGNPTDYREVVTAINGSGDLEVKLKALSSGAKALTFRNLEVSYRIFGSK